MKLGRRLAGPETGDWNAQEAGLGNTVSTEAITLSGTATATYACINGGGKHPSAANKETVTAPISTVGLRMNCTKVSTEAGHVTVAGRAARHSAGSG